MSTVCFPWLALWLLKGHSQLQVMECLLFGCFCQILFLLCSLFQSQFLSSSKTLQLIPSVVPEYFHCQSLWRPAKAFDKLSEINCSCKEFIHRKGSGSEPEEETWAYSRGMLSSQGPGHRAFFLQGLGRLNPPQGCESSSEF